MTVPRSIRNIAKTSLRSVLQRAGCGYLSSVANDYLDLQIASLLNHKRNGFFVEAGANDGINQSNTYYLEKLLGWKGLLVEPLPELADKCRRTRKGSHIENAALVRQNYPHSTVKLRRANLMSMVDDGTICKTEIEHHLKHAELLQQRNSNEIVTVPARSLSSILSEHHLERIDFFSLDVEGYEHEVLSGIDFDAVLIDRMLIETRSSNEATIREFLARKGYEIERGWINSSYSNYLFKLRIST